MNSRNPQRIPESFLGAGNRFLTAQEIVDLISNDPAKIAKRKYLIEYLKPEFYSQGACRWFPWNSDNKETFPAALTYRTAAPELASVLAKPLELQAAYGDFIESFEYVSADVHNTAKEKGWWNNERNDAEALSLIHSEISEALEFLRHGNTPDDKIPEFSGVEAELADCIIRIMDLAKARGWRIAEALVCKAEFNKTRQIKHGGKRF